MADRTVLRDLSALAADDCRAGGDVERDRWPVRPMRILMAPDKVPTFEIATTARPAAIGRLTRWLLR